MTSSNRNRETLVFMRLGLLALAVAALGNILGLWHTAALAGVLPDLCPIHRWTQHQCPGCGMGRALLQLTQGHVAAAVQQHPFAPLLGLWAALWALPPETAWRRLQHSRLIATDAPASVIVVALLIWWLFFRVV